MFDKLLSCALFSVLEGYRSAQNMCPALLQFIFQIGNSHDTKHNTNKTKIKQTKNIKDHFPSGPGVKSPPCNARDASSIPGGGTKTPHSIPQSSTTAEACTPQLVCVLQQKDPT